MQKEILSELFPFHGLSHTQIDIIEKYVKYTSHLENKLIFKQGDPSDHLYILLNGSVTIQHKLYDGPKIKIACIEPGGVFGWSCVLGRSQYTSEAIANTFSETYKITINDLRALYTHYPETGNLFLERLAGVISRRLLNTHSEILSILHRGIEVDFKQSTVYK